jgi:hypothetical protein
MEIAVLVVCVVIRLKTVTLKMVGTIQLKKELALVVIMHARLVKKLNKNTKIALVLQANANAK